MFQIDTPDLTIVEAVLVFLKSPALSGIISKCQRGGPMKAKVHKKSGVVVVNLAGFIDFETAQPFREACLKSFSQDVQSKIIFNLEGLNFVGSNGILPFVETLNDICDQTEGTVKFCKVSSEFQKIFKASPLRDVEIFADEQGALLSFQQRESESA